MKKFKTFVRGFIETFLSPILIILFYMNGTSIIMPIAKSMGNKNIISVLGESGVRVAVDSAILSILSSLILIILNNPVKVKGVIEPNHDLDKILIDLNSTRSNVKFHIKLDVNYRFNCIKNFIKLLGGTKLIIYNTDFTTMQKSACSTRLRDARMISSKEFQIPLECSVQENDSRGRSKITCILAPDTHVTETGNLKSELMPLIDRDKKIRYSILSFICKVLIEKDINNLEVQVYKDNG